MALTKKILIACVLWTSAAVLAQSPADDEVAARIRAEGLDRSQAGRVFTTLTSEIGPRLTASPAHKRAAEFARTELEKYGLSNVHLEPWAFGRGWTLDQLTVEMIEPRYMPLLAYADAWSPSTSGEIVATPVCICGKTPEDVQAMRAQLTGAIVMTTPALADFVRVNRPQPGEAGDSPALYGPGAKRLSPPETRDPAPPLMQALRDAHPAVLLKPSGGEHGTVFVTGHDDGPAAVPSVTLSAEHYNLVARLIDAGTPVRLRVNLRSTFHDADAGRAYNVIAELPGVDPARRDGVVMIGGHLDSWHTSAGAADNADGAATVIEAMRILTAAGVRPRRTIRAALWGGEEQGLLGSQAWANAHLVGDNNTAAREKLDVYFNVDAGTGKIFGWYLQNHRTAQPLMDAWLASLADLGTRQNVIYPIGSSDHLTFMVLGIPSFTAVQDYANYDVRTHHSNMDTPERVNEDDLRQAAIVMAMFAYRAAMADDPLPRPDLSWLPKRRS